MRHFEGLSDFFRNATDEEKQEFYSEVIERANQEQLEVIEKAKEIKELEQSTVTQTTPTTP